ATRASIDSRAFSFIGTVIADLTIMVDSREITRYDVLRRLQEVNVMRLFIWLILLVFSGCSFEPLGGVFCDSEGQRDGARICKDGVWTPVDPTTPIEDAGDDFSLDQDGPDLGFDQGDSSEGDMPESDMADLPDMVAPNDMSDMEDMTDMPDSCVPFSPQTLC